jgi:hypothetical protein
VVSERVPLDPAYVRALLNQAEEATFAGRSGEARKLYEQLVKEQEEVGQYSGTALWQLALNYLYADDAHKAARTLDELAAQADRFGDPAMEMRASFESGALWHQLKRDDLALPRIKVAQALLQSPVISKEDKQYITQRLEPADAER